MDEGMVSSFFAFERERYNILLRRRAGQPYPWTDDEVLGQFYFCNVFREDDRTTAWFRENLRGPLADSPKVLLATVAFRWFNRVETGERLKSMLLSGRWNSERALKAIHRHPAVHPSITGAYMVHSPRGYPKDEGLCRAIDGFRKEMSWKNLVGLSLQDAHGMLKHVKYLGGFTAYEIVTDLRWTSFLNPTDRNSWCHVGPGATRGLGRMIGGDPSIFVQDRDQEEMIGQCMLLLQYALSNGELWPYDWPRWELREVEHGLCEFDKYLRAVNFDGRMKRRYVP